MHDEIQFYNWSMNVKWVYQCVRVLYHNVQTSDMKFKTQNHVLANQTFNQGVKCINWYAKSYNKDQQ